MSRRARAVAFASAAALCAGLAAGAVGDRGPGIPSELGALRPAAVAREPVPAGAKLGPKLVQEAFEIRRVPERFLPPGTIADPGLASGRRTTVPIPAGGYLLADGLRAPGAGVNEPREVAVGGRPVEIAVSGAGAMSLAGDGGRVDVVVTTEPGPGGGRGRTYVAAEAVSLLDLRSANAMPTGGGLAGAATESSIATLAVSRKQALRLIQAESFARAVRLIPR